jgi:Flp pilus assembly protein TadG
MYRPFHHRCLGRTPRQRARGKVLVLLVITLPALCGLIGLMIDGGLLFAESRRLQDLADSAATAAAMEKMQGRSNADALAVATKFIAQYGQSSAAAVTLNCPPSTGPYAASNNHVELLVDNTVTTHVIQILSGTNIRTVRARAVAGFEPSTAGAAIIVLDPDPAEVSLAPLPALPISLAPPTLTAGLEIEGIGTARVDGAVLVNTAWGGLDEDSEQVGNSSGIGGLAHAVSATPLLSLTRLQARDLRVVGGVDSPANYGNYVSGQDSPLKAGRLPVPDPFQSLAVPPCPPIR